MKKILVTGADGFIGSHLVESLVKKGYETKAFVYYNSFDSKGWLDHSDINIKKSIEVFPGDIRDPYGVRTAIKGCDYVLHLAALIGIPFSYHSPESYIDTNVKGTLNVLQACRDLEIDKLIHTSTSEVYGTAQRVPISEDHPLQGQSPYSASKIAADQLAISFYNSFNTPLGIIRPLIHTDLGSHIEQLFPLQFHNFFLGKKILKLGSTSPTRDFSYVQDTVDGFIAAMISERIYGETINLGSSFEISIFDTVNTIADLMNVKVNIKEDPLRVRPPKSEVERLYSDNSKAKTLLSWEPKFGNEIRI